ncbi:hypothetical protein [Bacterioplanoides sp.]|uniref:hypothetical protein n=1 Tax=Bacterioplanoides sp. TaxID=2066072 RepID=UPI003B0086CD
MKKITASIFLLFITQFSNADEFGHCNTLINYGITNITKKMTSDHSVAYKWHSNCGQDFNSVSDNSVRKASISVFGYGSGDADSNTSHMRTRLKTWCNKNSDFAESRSNLFEEARTIGKPALDAWNQCQKTAKKGIGIDVSIQGENDEYVNFTIDSTSDGDHLFYGITALGFGCKVNGKNGAGVETTKIDTGDGGNLLMTKKSIKIDNKNIHINCVRKKPTITVVKGVGEILYEQGHISVMTSGPALPITIPSVEKTYYVTPPETVIAFASKECPKGWTDYSKADDRFILGSSATNPLYKTGGRKDIPTDGNHSHSTGGIRDGGWEPSGHQRQSSSNRNHSHGTNSTGNHNHGNNNMPPYIALKYCKRSR